MRKTLLSALACLLLMVPMGCEAPSAEHSLVEEAGLAFASGRYLKAEELYEQYIQTHPQGEHRWEVWSRLLDLALNVRSSHDKAVSLLEAMYLEFGSDPARAWQILSQLSESYRALRQWDKAIDTLQKAVALADLDEATLAQAYLRLARVHIVKREFDLARQALETCAETAPDPAAQADCLYDLAQTLGYMNKVAEARSVLEQIMDLNGTPEERRAQAVFLLADLYEQMEETAKARDLLSTILKTYPNPIVVETRLKHLEEKKD